MIIYVVAVKKAGNVIFSHDLHMNSKRSFTAEISRALEIFRKKFPTVNLLDEAVELLIFRKR